ncbi:GDSL-type esterase/lipase family protein [Leptolyngbya sp. NIES-2104]|uniref:GDSL-type esterase/lipase family protein n=1 Tax=Leptolyngbya sp. NIES-2104 TaxID=1552121 RepID=UPI0006ECB787|nr:GDSL-type esterase/lipase family protein [Leptolyngbya sp. NIES-2104]GAP95363.1 N-acetylneuraminate cytidylyltransferase [Leptolyngbya sp. NIES-2104]
MSSSTAFTFAVLSTFASSPLALSLLEKFPAPVADPQAATPSLSPLMLSTIPTTRTVAPVESIAQPEFSIATDSARSMPQSGGQLYLQRLAALRVGKLYTRLPSDSFREVWQDAAVQPTYEQWRKLLAMESRAVARRNSDRDLSILLGDSLSLWFPVDRLKSSQIWLNQGISGDTTWNILTRLPDLANTRPSEIYLMAGVNDLKMGASDTEIVWNIQRIIAQLQAMHPNAKIVLQSILPTRSPRIPNDQIAGINQQLKAIAERSGISFLDLFSQFVDHDGQILSEYTTDGIHLSAQGYAAWRSVFEESGSTVAASN